MKSWIEENRSETTPFDIVVEGKTQGNDSDEWYNVVNPWSEAGATWWIEAMWDAVDKKNSNELFVKRIRQGPPTI